HETERGKGGNGRILPYRTEEIKQKIGNPFYKAPLGNRFETLGGIIMLPLYERMNYILKAIPSYLIPLDISKSGDLFIQLSFTGEGGLSLYHSYLSKPNDKHLSLPKGPS
ncbi:MAG: hypothetical protein ACTSV2_07755, partial [Candidatus Thorarchaeota archaeon]